MIGIDNKTLLFVQRLFNEIPKINISRKQPILYLKVKSLDGSYTKPMYPDVLMHLRPHINPTEDLINASKTVVSITVCTIQNISEL